MHLILELQSNHLILIESRLDDGQTHFSHTTQSKAQVTSTMVNKTRTSPACWTVSCTT